MSCDYYVSKNEPVLLLWKCYICGKVIEIDKQESLNEHINCSRERNKIEVIPIILNVSKGYLEKN